MNRQSRTERAEGQRGFTLIELLIVVAIILIIASIAIPNFLRSRMAANEASAVEHVRAISTAVTVYSSTWSNGYPPTLGTLGGPATAIAATCDDALLLDPLITTPPFQKAGYTFSYNGVGANTPPAAGCAAQGYNAYLTTAVPMIVGTSGGRSFCSDLPGTIHFDVTGAAIASTAACDALPPL
jgi:prepilin-type N-terminal cleavage/methylation domain-containing protein